MNSYEYDATLRKAPSWTYYSHRDGIVHLICEHCRTVTIFDETDVEDGTLSGPCRGCDRHHRADMLGWSVYHEEGWQAVVSTLYSPIRNNDDEQSIYGY